MRPLVIHGVGPLARLMFFHWTRTAGVEVAAFTVDRPFLREATCEGLPVIPFDELPDRFGPERFDLFLAVGYRRMRSRLAVFERAKAAGYRLPNFISPRAAVHGDCLGENNIILDNVVVEPFARLQDHNVLWTGAIVAHDTRVGSHNFFAPRSTVAGNCVIGDLCFFGVGAATIDGLVVADETMLVAGSTLFHDTRPGTRYHGNPAMADRVHQETGIVIERSHAATALPSSDPSATSEVIAHE